MKNIINALACALIGAAMLQGCNTLEITMPEGPRGEQGIQGKDGLSAYEVWLKAVGDGIITDWNGGTGLADFFLYLKGKDGIDGRDGLSAYDLWKEYVAGGVPDPHDPGKEWDKDKVSVADFYWFLTGRDGNDGVTPHIGDNGNWWIGDIDTGRPARGDKGDKGDTGDAGADGVSAYEAWRDYVMEESRHGRTVKDADGNEYTDENCTLHDFFLFLTGCKGADGKDGKDGKDGEDGKPGGDGLSAYDLWVVDVTSAQGLEDPHNPGRKWDPKRISVQDFWDYLRGTAGADGRTGADGLSAYAVWKAMVLSESGLANPGNGIYDPGEYPCWPKDRTGYSDFWDYLRGRDGEDGRDGRDGTASAGDTVLVYGAVKGMYNLTAVPALKVKSCGASGSDDTERFDFVNPFTGGAWFVVTGPEGVLIPGCTVTFANVLGGSYTRTSDSDGCIYLSREELPEYSPGDPSASDNPVRPSSFSFGTVTVTDPSLIARTCVVPYRVGLAARMITSTLSYNSVESRVAVYRIVEGDEEEVYVEDRDGAVRASFPNPACFSVCMSKIDSTNQVRTLEGTSSPSLTEAEKAAMAAGRIHMGTFFRQSVTRPRTRTAERSTAYAEGRFGDGESPSQVSVHFTPYSMMKVIPDYGTRVVTPERTHIPEIRFMEGLDVSGLKGDNVSYNGNAVTDGTGAGIPVPVNKTNYELILGQTSFSFALDWHSFGQCYVEGDGTLRAGTYEYKRYDSLDGYLATLAKSPEVLCRLAVSGKLNGVDISNAVDVRPAFSTSTHSFSDGSYTIRNVYDGFDIGFSRTRIGKVSYEGVSGVFFYDANDRFRASCTLGCGDGIYGLAGFTATYRFQAIVDAVSEPFVN